MRRARWSTLVSLVIAVGAVPRVADANMAKAVFDGDRHGVLVPSGNTAVRVDAESISFALARSLESAAVTASYRLTNTSGVGEATDVAFAFVRGDVTDRDPVAAVDVDGGPVRVRVASDGEILAPKLGAWLDEHPDIARELRTPGGCADPAKLRALVEAAGGRCDRECSHLAAWQKSLATKPDAGPSPEGAPDAGDGRRGEDDIVYEAAREAVPSAALDLVERWSTLTDHRRLGFLLFHLDFQPRQTRTVAVHYEHRAAIDRGAHANATLGFDYLLSPAKRWASFGPLDVTVRVPGHTRFTSPLPFTRDGDTYRAELATLPAGELRFEAMSLDGLWFGMTEPRGYWAIVAAAMATVALAVGVAAGRLWGGASGWKRVILPLVGGGPLAAVSSLAALVVLLASFPAYALGFGYDAVLGGGLLVFLAAAAGAAASALSAARLARKSR